MDTSLSRMVGGAALLVVVTMQGMAAQAVKPQSAAKAQPDTATRIEIYGFAQADAIGDFRSNNPDWFDVNRPSKLPAFPDEFGHNGHTWFSARQSRFGAKATIPTSSGKDIKVVFDWDLFGVGIDAGQTTIRPRHMYGQWGDFGGGQLESPFMDLDVFPNILEYWGPNGMLFYRNVQVFWQPIHREDGTRVTLALERPGASGDGGIYADRIELQNIKARFPMPDLTGEWRIKQTWGYFKASGSVNGLQYWPAANWPNSPQAWRSRNVVWPESTPVPNNSNSKMVFKSPRLVGVVVLTPSRLCRTPEKVRLFFPNSSRTDGSLVTRKVSYQSGWICLKSCPISSIAKP